MPNPVLTPERWKTEAPEGDVGWAAPQGSGTGAAAGAAAGKVVGEARPIDRPPTVGTGRRMTVGGTLSATAVLLLCILVTGAIGWSQVSQTTEIVGELIPGQEPQTQVVTSYPGWVFLPMLLGFGMALVTVFKPNWARLTAPLYALCFGFAIGAISHMFNLQFDGIVLQAIGATLGVFLVMLFLYATRIVKVTSRFVLGVVAATGGIFVLYLAGAIASIFGADIAFWNDPTPLGIGISVVIVIVAALNLAIDFNFIEQAVRSGAPKSMEWYGAFGLTVTLVWLYLEILRLLSLLRQ